MTPRAAWPVLKTYDSEHLLRIALPLGGIGTGTVSLGGRGDLRDWEIVNRPAKGFQPGNAFFCLRTEQNAQVVTRCLEGPVDLSLYEGAFGVTVPNHGLPRFANATFEAAYPFGQVVLTDAEVPVSVRLQAFNPLNPADADRSGIPIAVLRYILTNTGDTPVEANLCGSLQNFIGTDGSGGKADRNVNRFRTGDSLSGIFMESKGVAPTAAAWGSMALAVTATERVSYRTAWAQRTWGDSLLDFWDDFEGDGVLEDRDGGTEQAPTGSLAVSVTVPPQGTAEVTFLLAWRFPNRQIWSPDAATEAGADSSSPNWVGNHYCTLYRNAWDVLTKTAPILPELEAQTNAFVSAVLATEAPEPVKEAALFNLTGLRSQTSFRTADGLFFGWEGCGDKCGCCEGSCTHVWNYEQATAFLFGSLSRSMREVEFLHATTDDGLMSFRALLPLKRATEFRTAAADGQMGCLMKLYRDWRLCGDTDWLRKLWPRARRAMEFAWIPGGWDADQDGVMEGCQHNTMDVEYFGPNPQMTGWYLGALRACEEMARALGDSDFAQKCSDLFRRGSAWTDANLFNGDYYEHQIVPAANEAAIAPGLRHPGDMGAKNLAEPELQLGSGCLIDQLVGQFMAHVCGLGYLLDPTHVRKTLESILKWNRRDSLQGHFNHMRTFALGNESALLMASYPKGRRPNRPFPYYNEVMTGFEHTAAVHMLYEGMTAEGAGVIAAVRDRYDGRKRNPFDEAECGHHYARAMASWAAIVAFTGFHYDGITQTMEFGAVQKSAFWSTGNAWGTLTMNGGVPDLRVLGGTAAVAHLIVGGQPFEPQINAWVSVA